MSTRNVRKLFGTTTLPPPTGSSDEEYEPLYTKVAPTKYNYQALSLSSHSESEHESTDARAVENAVPENLSKKKRRKKKKQRNARPKRVVNNEQHEEMDEIDRSVMEVNAMLGAPPSASVVETPVQPELDLFAVQQKHLNSANELRRWFGPDALEEGQRRRGRDHNAHMLRKAYIVPIAENVMNFRKFGLSMSLNRREGDLSYFTFDHSREYQRVHRAYTQIIYYNNVVMPIEEAQRNMHVEGLLESADSMFRIEEYSAANTTLEQIIAYMHYVAHPSFNLTSGKTRLEYKYEENRPFHIAILKYLYMLTNRACHRTALELSKLLLKLDPTDPLAVLFIIDTLALRAREHQWLIDAVDYWSRERDAGFLFNMQYSYAMAHFHVAMKTSRDTSKADNLLQNAMMRFPTVTMKILECATVTPSALLQSHPLFNPESDEATARNLKDLVFLYAKLTWAKWREPPVMEWFTRNANELAEKYNNDTDLQERAKKLKNERLNIFRGWPEEIIRHLCIIKPMANLLVDGAVPRVNRYRAYNPVPPVVTVNRYGYGLERPTVTPSGHSALYELFSSVLPRYVTRFLIQRDQVEGLQERHNIGELEVAAAAAAAAGNDALPDEENIVVLPADSAEEDSDGFEFSVDAFTHTFRRFLNPYENDSDHEEINENEQPPQQERPNDN